MMPIKGEIAQSGFISWSTPEFNWKIECLPEVVEQIRAYACDSLLQLSHGGRDVGGVLYGVRADGVIRIVSWRQITCEYAEGDGLQLSHRDRMNLAVEFEAARSNPDLKDLRPVGWFVSHPRGSVSMTTSDLENFSNFFPESSQFALVIHPLEEGRAEAGYFMRQADGNVRAEASYNQFVIEPMQPLPPDRAPLIKRLFERKPEITPPVPSAFTAAATSMATASASSSSPQPAAPPIAPPHIAQPPITQPPITQPPVVPPTTPASAAPPVVPPSTAPPPVTPPVAEPPATALSNPPAAAPSPAIVPPPVAQSSTALPPIWPPSVAPIPPAPRAATPPIAPRPQAPQQPVEAPVFRVDEPVSTGDRWLWAIPIILALGIAGWLLYQSQKPAAHQATQSSAPAATAPALAPPAADPSNTPAADAPSTPPPVADAPATNPPALNPPASSIPADVAPADDAAAQAAPPTAAGPGQSALQDQIRQLKADLAKERARGDQLQNVVRILEQRLSVESQQRQNRR